MLKWHSGAADPRRLEQASLKLWGHRRVAFSLLRPEAWSGTERA